MSDTPIPAATLVVMRDRDGAPPELLMVERSAGMAFAGGAMVFPGGRIDTRDGELAAALGDDDGGGAQNAGKLAAIRETLEESSVAVGLTPTPDPALAAALAEALHAGEDFGTLLASNDLALDLAAGGRCGT